MIRNRNNSTSRLTRRERNTPTEDVIKYDTAQAEGPEYSSFPADCHQAILNKPNRKSKRNRKQKASSLIRTKDGYIHYSKVAKDNFFNDMQAVL